MFERFTDRARRVVVLAQEEARLLNHNWIGTEHLLLGLMKEGEGVGFVVLTNLGLDLTKTERMVVEHAPAHSTPVTTGHIPFTPRGKKVIELSLREALQLGHNYIGTEHLLLGMLREGEGVAAKVLVLSDIDLSRARQAVIATIVGYEGPEERPAAPQRVGRTVIEIETKAALELRSFCETYAASFGWRRSIR